MILFRVLYRNGEVVEGVTTPWAEAQAEVDHGVGMGQLAEAGRVTPLYAAIYLSLEDLDDDVSFDDWLQSARLIEPVEKPEE